MPNEPTIRKRRLFSAPVTGNEIDLATVARTLKTSQATLRELFEQGQLQRLLLPRGRSLVSTEQKLRQWQDRPPKRNPAARKPKGQEILRAHFADVKGAAERWWLTALWKGSLLDGMRWETEVPRSELLAAFGGAVGQRGTKEPLLEFLARMLPETSPPREIRYLTRKIVDGAVKQTEELWVTLADLASCRKQFAEVSDCEIDWYVATPDPVVESARAELIKQSRADADRTQDERDKELAERLRLNQITARPDVFANIKKRQAIIDEAENTVYSPEDLAKYLTKRPRTS
jgi:hypothetical protein